MLDKNLRWLLDETGHQSTSDHVNPLLWGYLFEQLVGSVVNLGEFLDVEEQDEGTTGL